MYFYLNFDIYYSPTINESMRMNPEDEFAGYNLDDFLPLETLILFEKHLLL